MMRIKRELTERTNGTAVNVAYQTFYQILTLITPLITSPHISRVLGADNLGVFTYTFSIVSYFMLIAALGVINYGTRTIALCKGDRKERSKAFCNVYCVQALSSIIAIIGYVIYIHLYYSNNENIIERTIALMQGMWLLSNLFDVNWFFFGVEAFKKTVTRNIIIKILTVLSIILFVKNGHHPLVIYTLIMAGGHLISNLVLLPMLRQYIDFVIPEKSEMAKHIKPNLVLFVPLLASSVFHTMDKTMLGLMSPRGGKAELGYYYNSDKLINIPLGIINGFGTVFLPRATKLFSDDKKNGYGFINKTFELNIAVTCLLSFGIAGCAKEFVPFFFGSGYEECIILAYLFVPVLMVKAVSIFFRMQYLVPTHKDLVYTKATIAGALVNLVVNSILIPDHIGAIQLPGLGARGAVIGTFVAEAVVMLYQFIAVRGDLPVKAWVAKSIIYTIIGALLLIAMRIVSVIDVHVILKILMEVATGGIVFGLITIFFWKVSGQFTSYKALLLGLIRRR